MLHHLQTFSYMLWASTLGRGAFSVMMLMSSGEVSAPLQNVWMLAKNSRDTSRARRLVGGPSPRVAPAASARLSQHRRQFAARLHEAIAPVFTVFFTLMRVVIGPPVVYLVIAARPCLIIRL